MKRIFIQVILPLLVLAAIGLGSCKNRNTEGQQTIVMDERAKIEKSIEKSVYPLPTSAEVIKLLNDLEIGYMIGISNPIEKASGYLTSKTRAINLGIYGADLSYATLYNMQQDVINYLYAVRILANDLNMSQIYDESLYASIKENFDNKDSLVVLLTDAFNKTYGYLSDNNQEPLALLVVGASWVEGMFITTNISESVYDVEGIVRVFLEQKNSFDLFMDIAKPHADDPLIAEFLKDLEPIGNVYAGIETSLTKQNVMDIKKAIETVRGKLTE
jgi:hypothetical protein